MSKRDALWSYTRGVVALGWVGLLSLPLAGGAAGTGKLPDTGITKRQCYRAGSSVLVSCTSPAAVALNAQQDGITGLDVTSPGSKNGKLGFNYTKIAADGTRLAADATEWACVKDNITGLMWEVKTADGGVRDMYNLYTNYGDRLSGDASAFVRAVNAVGLCGKSNWRLPTVDELQGLVDYGVDYNTGKPTIDETYFPNTAFYWYWWTSSPVVGYSDVVWFVHFYDGCVSSSGRGNGLGYVRLVR